jgi:hypothetical protein
VTAARGPRRGAALAAAVYVLLVLGVLIAAVSFAALQEYRVGSNSVRSRRAIDAAEAGLEATLAGWKAAGLSRMATGGTASISGTLPAGSGAYGGFVRSLNPRLFLINSTGADASGLARRTLAVVARLSPVRVAVAAALTVGGTVRVGASGLVDGLGADPDGWSCPDAPDTVAGVLLAAPDRLTLEECESGGCVRGDPAVGEDPALLGAVVPVIGESGWASLAGAADVDLPPGAFLGSPADTALTVLHALGDLEIGGGERRGVLLVDGDLVLGGGVRFLGLVVVRGTLRFRDAGGSVAGAVLAGAADLGGGGASGPRGVAFSSCALARALAAAGTVSALPERAWAELF